MAMSEVPEYSQCAPMRSLGASTSDSERGSSRGNRSTALHGGVASTGLSAPAKAAPPAIPVNGVARAARFMGRDVRAPAA